MLNLQIALRGAPLVALARALAKLDGVRVTGGPDASAAGSRSGSGRERSYLVHCLGFKMVLTAPPAGEAGDFALALVSRTPQVALAVMSDLGSVLERLMSEPPRPVDLASFDRDGSRPAEGDSPGLMKTSSTLRRSTLQQGKPLVRKTALRRKTRLARSRFRKP